MSFISPLKLSRTAVKISRKAAEAGWQCRCKQRLFLYESDDWDDWLLDWLHYEHSCGAQFSINVRSKATICEVRAEGERSICR